MTDNSRHPVTKGPYFKSYRSEPGLQHSLEFCIRFLDWADHLGRIPTPTDIARRWNVSRATSYRYRSALLAAKPDLLRRGGQ